jgi:putative ATPase
MKDLDYGKEYKYSHNYTRNFVNQEFLPNDISGTKIYEPGNNQRENKFREILKNHWKNKYDY